jgi:cold shock CspA family protein
MGRSTETFSKKEKEKARLKKRKDKEEKREERKANPGKGQSLEDMLVYVDENGNLTSTPPDPSRRREINVDDIQVGVSRQEDLPEEAGRRGTVTFFNASKGYGFIRDQRTQESLFVHVSGLKEPVGEGDKVSFEVTNTPKGPNAIEVRKAV